MAAIRPTPADPASGAGPDSPRAKPELTAEVACKLARKAGFAEAGVVPLPYPAEARDAARFGEWLKEGRAGSMHYLSRTTEDGQPLRARAAIPFPWARSVVVCIAGYKTAQPCSTDPSRPESGWIARYAGTSRRDENGNTRPSDYHKILLKRLRILEAGLHEHCGEFESRAFVDTGPLVERALAVAAGLGWTGKNTTLIHPRLGSYSFLAVLLTSLETHPVTELVPDRCGSCRRCLDACPTGALIAPRQMDARRCIAYLTIEHRGPIEEFREAMGRQVFGCDICQDVCPWNHKAPVVADPDFAPRAELINPALAWLAELNEQDYESMANASPLRRAKLAGLRRNVAIAMGNSGLSSFLPRLEKWTEAEDGGLRSAARWAVDRLRMKNVEMPG